MRSISSPGVRAVVERHVEPQAVQRQVGAQGVGGGPAHIFAHVGVGHGDPLVDEGDGQEEHPRVKRLSSGPWARAASMKVRTICGRASCSPMLLKSSAASSATLACCGFK